MKHFEDLGLSESVLRAVAAEGYDTPTPIQAETIPVLLDGNDVLGIAQTGTGKTASFVLPLLNRLEGERGRCPKKTCNSLILAPTRELAAQIAANIRTYSRFMKVSVAVVVGGVKPAPQIRALNAGAQIVVATPGRLLDHMKAGFIRLDQTSSVIIDEADQMLDLGFIPAIRKIVGALPTKRQTVLMSATMPPPVRRLAEDFLTEPTEIAVAAVARPIERIQQSVRHVAKAAKRTVLTQILSEAGVERSVVFTRTKRGADRVNQHLERSGLSTVVIHGDKSQGQRKRALSAFRSGEAAIMVATDIAARGIDIDDITHVVNFDLPNVPEAYVHRIGRTARAGRDGVAITLCDPTERGLLRDIERLIGSPIEQGEGNDTDQDIAGEATRPERRSNRRPNRGSNGAKAGKPRKPKKKMRRRADKSRPPQQGKPGPGSSRLHSRRRTRKSNAPAQAA
ncbi:DEAD/DEAH box helicase [Hoeflea prorocentri]|uniref:DEAD/DEAH box helicase n=1 Tax=Hoeflea prorocentri TaxID=1922333 RepID=A0A9X3UK28_9HYPH|nr:DEAD/DEAH box helicase [Hoeflea prorocentri]MCY6382255.1 DEAD/DEAH box helicase [Hoeflea prorocentri]MDA5400055.1 DEAD/DEAH box helicase [Hoeflea prorocentri]